MSVQELIIDNLDLWTDAVTHKSDTGRGNNGKVELTGIKKLRELILELAVRGKLVEQDPNDEPASMLLGRISEEKARLVKEGKIKKLKKLPEISGEEVTTKIPPRWAWARLGEVTNYGATDKAEPGEVENTSWVLELEDIEKESSRLLKKVKYSDRPFKSSKNRFIQGDVLYGKLRPYLDKVLVAECSGVCTTEIIPIRGFNGVFSPYLRIALKSPGFKAYANNSTHGMNLPRLGTEKARLALIPLPPTEEQKRIAEKVDDLMALCDQLEQQVDNKLEAHEVLVDTLLGTLSCSEDAADLAKNWTRVADHFDILFTTESSIYKLKQTIIQLAIMGRLVPQDPKDEPASTLLKDIEFEKKQLVKKGKIKKPKPLPSLKPKETPYELPQGWEWTRLGNLAVSSDSGWSPQCLPEAREDGHWGVLKVSAVSWGYFNPKENKALPIGKSPRLECIIKKDDFLISRANTNDLVARSVIVEDACEKLMMSDKIVRFNFSHHVNKHFINLANGTSFSRDYYSQKASGTSSSMKNVSRQVMAELPIPLPPLTEQQRIVTKINQLESIFKDLEEKIVAAAAKKDNLFNSVMEKVLGEACA